MSNRSLKALCSAFVTREDTVGTHIIFNRITYFVFLGLFGSPSSRVNDGRSLFNYTDAALFSFYSPG